MRYKNGPLASIERPQFEDSWERGHKEHVQRVCPACGTVGYVTLSPLLREGVTFVKHPFIHSSGDKAESLFCRKCFSLSTVKMGGCLSGLVGVVWSMVTNVARFGIWSTLWTCSPDKLETFLARVRLRFDDLPDNIKVAMEQHGLVTWSGSEQETISAQTTKSGPPASGGESERARICGRLPITTSMAFAAQGPEELVPSFLAITTDLAVMKDWSRYCVAATYIGSSLLLRLRAPKGPPRKALEDYFLELLKELSAMDHLGGLSANLKELQTKLNEMNTEELFARFESELVAGDQMTIVKLHRAIESVVGEWLLAKLAGVKAAALKPWSRVVCSNYCEPLCVRASQDLQMVWLSVGD
jgi:hypothetical protein